MGCVVLFYSPVDVTESVVKWPRPDGQICMTRVPETGARKMESI